jgi:hypothetical protein
MATLYKLQKDIAGYNGFGLPFSDLKYTASLAATTDTTLTIPTVSVIGAPLNQKQRFLAIVSVESSGSVWCALNATAAVPVGATFAASTSELIVGGQYYAREVQGEDVMHFFTATAATDISVTLYSLPAS